ncbi:hypothetical protein [Longibacter salinarum]|uniref:hypothetical protein n=1 Tax=Longibacter salinarum TaxID=1850348 RepID=UPI00117F36D7|nr:hypothetical protein [Longibacter salinarum]
MLAIRVLLAVPLEVAEKDKWGAEAPELVDKVCMDICKVRQPQAMVKSVIEVPRTDRKRQPEPRLVFMK